MSESTVERSNADSLARTAAALGVAAVLVFFIGGIAISDVFWLIGAIVGLAAAVLGWMARNRPSVDAADRRLATIGLGLGAIIVVWFLVFLIGDAIF